MNVITSVLLMLAFVVILALAILLVISLYLGFRSLSLYKKSGSFECNWLSDHSQKWQSGVAQYNVHELTWYRLVAFSGIPELRWKRSSIKFDPSTVKVDENDPNKIIVEFKYREFFFALHMSSKDYEGFISWLDSGLPGTKAIY